VDDDRDPYTAEGRTLAVDLGARRIGLAVSDPLDLTAQGLPSLERRRDAIAQVLEVCREWGVGSVVVGLPLNMNGTKGPAAVAAEEFAAALAARSGLPVVVWDERLSSASAEKVLIEAGVGRDKRRKRGLVDRGAATIFLQTYLDRRRSHT
jgi:putative Holliday junction resolvase